MFVKSIITGELQSNTYIYCDEESLEALIIDPGDSFADIADYIEDNDIRPVAILLTHAHYDHFASAALLKENYSLPIILGDADKQLLTNPHLNLSKHFFYEPISIIPDETFSDGELYEFKSNAVLKVISTPGHSPGSVCYYVESDNILFSGDTLFYGSIGRTDFELGNFNQIIDSITNKLMTLPDNTIVYPGHGMKTTIRREKLYNPLLN